jgi:hypothetical protein
VVTPHPTPPPPPPLTHSCTHTHSRNCYHHHHQPTTSTSFTTWCGMHMHCGSTTRCGCPTKLSHSSLCILSRYPECVDYNGVWMRDNTANIACPTSGVRVTLHPCCIGHKSTCELLTETQCDFEAGIWHEDKQVGRPPPPPATHARAHTHTLFLNSLLKRTASPLLLARCLLSQSTVSLFRLFVYLFTLFVAHIILFQTLKHFFYISGAL